MEMCRLYIVFRHSYDTVSALFLQVSILYLQVFLLVCEDLQLPVDVYMSFSIMASGGWSLLHIQPLVFARLVFCHRQSRCVIWYGRLKWQSTNVSFLSWTLTLLVQLLMALNGDKIPAACSVWTNIVQVPDMKRYRLLSLLLPCC